ncbi:hypothetical protein CH75_08025 [Dyella jiangningensis]|nr:hypothetical protein CH75_08025 [Dyella jiangningensis]
MNRTVAHLKRDLVRLEVDAATLHRHYAGTGAFVTELSGLACDVLLSASESDQAWVRTSIEAILARYGLAPQQWLKSAPPANARRWASGTSGE